MKFVTFCLLLLLLTITFCYGKKIVLFRECGSVMGQVENVYIDPCYEEPCYLKHGQNTTVTIDFLTFNNVSSGTAFAHAKVYTVDYQFKIYNKQLCPFINTGCPIEQGQLVSYTNKIFIPSWYPRIKLVVLWNLLDESGKVIVCAAFPDIVNAQKKSES